jgi:GMP synthase-like glutamine amidotransferase
MDGWMSHTHNFVHSIGCKSVFHAWENVFPTTIELQKLQGIVITGSLHSINDTHLPWINPLLRFLSDCISLELCPVYGGCFGCQAIGKAMDGVVGKNPSERFIFKTESIQFDAEVVAHYKFLQSLRGVPSLNILETHEDCVLEPPPRASLCGSSESTTVEMFTIGEWALGIQGHPELTVALLLQKILPAIVAKDKLTKEEVEAAMITFEEKILNSNEFLRVILQFLLQRRTRKSKS